MYKNLWKNTSLRYTVALLFVILFSTAVLSPYFSRPQTHSASFDVIRECREQATSISLTVTLASTAVTVLKDDIGTPIANELANLSAPLMVIVCVLYLEQYLLTAMEAFAFSILLPLACFFSSYLCICGAKACMPLA